MPHRYLTFPGLLFVFPDHPPASRSRPAMAFRWDHHVDVGVFSPSAVVLAAGQFSVGCPDCFPSDAELFSIGYQDGCRNTFDGMSRMRSVGCRDGFVGSRGRGMVDWGERRRRCGVGGKRVSTKRKGSASRCQRRRRNNLANSSGRTGQCNLFPTQVVLRFHVMKPTHGRCAVTMSRSRRIGAVWGPEAESSDPTRSASVCSSLRLAVLEHRLCRRPA